MKVKEWYQKRGTRFLLKRAAKLFTRYGLSPAKSARRNQHCVNLLKAAGYLPTFFVPATIVERNPGFILSLQDQGCEIGVHGYEHVDLKTCHTEEACNQILHAANVFRSNTLEAHGFRCPYLSSTDELIRVFPRNVLEYSSNKAIQWPYGESAEKSNGRLFDTIRSFYVPVPAKENLCIPWQQDGLIEIPVCVPDDLQLYDGLGYSQEQISAVWMDILSQTYRRGELFNLMFHPELASFFEDSFLSVLNRARALRPQVWAARLCDISTWWKEKSTFRVEIVISDNHYALIFHCTERAAILCRGFDPEAPNSRWDEDYYRLETHSLFVKDAVLPLIGLAPAIPQWITTALQGMGYILVSDKSAPRCSIYLDETLSGKFGNPVDLIAFLERSREPLVRFWPWPDGKRSALCITGDLDALSLYDYAARFLKR